MYKKRFVQFSDDHITYNSKRFDGYLAFLPEPITDSNGHHLHSTAEGTSESHLSYRYFSGKEFCWFEFKDTQLPAGLSMQVTSSGDYLWLLINMRTGISLTLDSIRLVPTDMLLCYQTLIDEHLISLGDNSNWFMLLGVDGSMLRDLMAEYTQLKPLLNEIAEDDTPSHRIIGTTTLHAKLKRVLDGLQQMEFRPFSTYYQLANWNMRFFQRVFQDMEAQSAEKTDHEIELYYKAVTYIRENFYDDRTNIQTVAAALYVSESTLKRAFRNKPLSITEQIIEFRLQEARELIRDTNKPIAKIASSLNFACPKNFKRLFNQRFSLSPLQYRNNMRVKRLF